MFIRRIGWMAVLWMGCLAGMAGCRRADKAADALQERLRGLESVDPQVRYEAAVALGRGGERAAVGPLVACLGDMRLDVRRAAVEALGAIGDAAAVGPLGAVMNDAGADGELRRLAAGALGRMAHPSAVPALEAALRSDDAELVQSAAFALGRVGDQGANAALTAALRGGSPHARRAAAKVLGQSAGKEGAERMRELLSDASADIRLSAAESMARLGDAQAIPAVVELLMDPDRTVQIGVRPLVMGFGEKAVGPLERILRLPGRTIERTLPGGEKRAIDLAFARGVAREAVLKMRGRVAVRPLLFLLGPEGGRGKDGRHPLVALMADEGSRAELRAAIEAGEARAAELGLTVLADHFTGSLPGADDGDGDVPNEEAPRKEVSGEQAPGGGADDKRASPSAPAAPDREACRELAARLLGGAPEVRFQAARLLCALGDARGREPLRRAFLDALSAIRKAWAEYDEKNPYPTRAPEGRNKEGQPLTLEGAQRSWWQSRAGVAGPEMALARAHLEALFSVADKSLADELVPVLKTGDAYRNHAWNSVLSAAVRILDKVRNPAYLDPLLAAMESGRGGYLTDVAVALGAFGDPRGFDPIERYVANIGPNDQYFIEARVKCYRGLYGCDRERAARVVGEILTTTPAHQRGPLQATARLMAEYPVAGAVPSLVHWLHHDIQSVQETVRKALVSVTKGHVGWLIENFEVESHAKRSALAGLVADEFGAAAVPDLVKAARDKSPRMRQGATWALACIGGPEAVEVVRQSLKDEHPQVRSAAAWGVGRLGKRDLADALVALLADGDPAPRSMAVEQLGALGATNAVQPLIRALGDADVKVRGYAIIALAKLQAREALDAVTALMADENPDVKAAAEQAVRVLRGRKEAGQ